jgi:hypothetical protein
MGNLERLEGSRDNREKCGLGQRGNVKLFGHEK